MENTQFGARLNSFKLGLVQPEIEEAGNLTLALLKRASKAGLTCADLNFPDHFSNLEVQKLKNFLKAKRPGKDNFLTVDSKFNTSKVVRPRDHKL